MFTCGWAWPALSRSPIWDSGEQSSQKCVIPGLGRRWAAVQNLTPLALSAEKKSVTIQTNTQTNDKLTDISTPCLSSCVDKISYVLNSGLLSSWKWQQFVFSIRHGGYATEALVKLSSSTSHSSVADCFDCYCNISPGLRRRTFLFHAAVWGNARSKSRDTEWRRLQPTSEAHSGRSTAESEMTQTTTSQRQGYLAPDSARRVFAASSSSFSQLRTVPTSLITQYSRPTSRLRFGTANV